MRPAERDDLQRLAGLLALAARDNLAVALRRLADRIEVPDPYLPKAQARAGGTSASTSSPGTGD